MPTPAILDPTVRMGSLPWDLNPCIGFRVVLRADPPVDPAGRGAGLHNPGPGDVGASQKSGCIPTACAFVYTLFFPLRETILYAPFTPLGVLITVMITSLP